MERSERERQPSERTGKREGQDRKEREVVSTTGNINVCNLARLFY